jgi:hypothetical protein
VYKKCMGIDPAYRSPSFGIVVVQIVDGQLQILHAEEYKRPDFNEMLLVKYSIKKQNPVKDQKSSILFQVLR